MCVLTTNSTRNVISNVHVIEKKKKNKKQQQQMKTSQAATASSSFISFISLCDPRAQSRRHYHSIRKTVLPISAGQVIVSGVICVKSQFSFLRKRKH